jgi:hypothetical protein
MFGFLTANFSKPLNLANLAIYSGNYFFLPIIASFWLLIHSMWHCDLRTKWLFPIVGFFVALFYVVLLLPGYIFSWIPVLLMALFDLRWNKPERRFSKKAIATILLIGILMPNISAFVHYNSILREASTIAQTNDKAIFISSHIYEVNTFTPLFRAYNDWWAFLLSSAGMCGEMATATIGYLNQLGFDARKIGLPGENHEFVEVKVNDIWYVLDPGYYPHEILTRPERANRRISSTDIGAISYVIAYSGSSFIELTQYYVDTDTITIRILNNGEPVTNAKMYLIHEFMGSNARLPDAVSFYFTDTNGTVTLKMGALKYSDESKPFEPYYWIWINDKNTGYNVTSTGTGATQYKEIDIANLR